MRAVFVALASALVGAFAVIACTPVVYDAAQFRAEGDAIVLRGAIDGGTPAQFAAFAQANPQARRLVLQYVPGSFDNNANLELARAVRRAGYTTEVPAGGLIASGAVDLFFAGTTRVLGPGACVGVHSWRGGFDREGRDLPPDHRAHRLYLSYFADIGAPAAFYWFTLAAAPSSSVHWMSAAEADRFGLGTGPAPALGQGASCNGR